MNGGHLHRRVTRARSLYCRRCRSRIVIVVVVEVVEVVEEKFRRAARSILTTLFYAHPVAIVAVDVVVVVDDVSSAARSLRAPVGCTRWPRKRLAWPDPRHPRRRMLARSSVRARARRRVTLVKFQSGIWVKTSPPRNARRNADTRERRTETERTRNRVRQRREKGRENDSPVSPPSLPGERLWRRPGSHCCFPRHGVTRGGWLREGRGDTIISQHPLARRTNPHGTGAWRRRRVCVSWWEIARKRKGERGRACGKGSG